MPQTMIQIETAKENIAQAISVETPVPALPQGAILCAVESFALTANNVTYAVMGEQMAYWRFFPASRADNGIVPVWGHARVITSQHDDIAVGEQLYGYWPMASHAILHPGDISRAGFLDMAAHRQGLAEVYNRYRRLKADPAHQQGQEGHRAVFEPLFTTSFLIADMFHRAQWHNARNLVITSASSKTALALAHIVQATTPQIRRIGLTSPVNLDFVKATGLYDSVHIYDDLEGADTSPAVSVDFAGNGAVLARVHSHWQDNLRWSALVGATHIEERTGAGNLAGPKPELFFAPFAAKALLDDLGAAGFARAVAERWLPFIATMGNQIRLEDKQGADAVRAAWQALVANQIAPDIGLIARLGSG